MRSFPPTIFLGRFPHKRTPSKQLHSPVLLQLRLLPEEGSSNPEHRVLGKGRVGAGRRGPGRSGGGRVGEEKIISRERGGREKERRSKGGERERVSNKQAKKEPNSTMGRK